MKITTQHKRPWWILAIAALFGALGTAYWFNASPSWQLSVACLALQVSTGFTAWYHWRRAVAWRRVVEVDLPLMLDTLMREENKHLLQVTVNKETVRGDKASDVLQEVVDELKG